MEVGSRVVRGPDWMWGDQDGGEGNVGTVVQHGQDRNLPDGTVLVHWDSGRQANYRAGHSGKFDLRILDCAQAGVKHTFVTCDGCKQSPLAGTRWKCADCPDYDLCSPCFMNDVHNMHHSFLRFDISGGDGIPVGKRPNFTKQQSRGLFPGARVTRGRDWKWGDKDGGGGHVGQLTEITSWNGVERAGANVMWSLLSRNTYRTGHMGEVDLKCSSSAIGPPYYRECLAKFGENRRRLDSSRLRVGDRVSVCLDAEVLRAMSAGHGGWVDDMAKCIGKVGKISKIDADGDVHVSYGLQSWVFHPQAVTKVPSFQAGDKVRILSDKQLVQNLQQGHGGWHEKMTTALGKEGRILHVDSDGDAVVLVDSDLWLLNPAALEDMSEGGEATSRRGDTSPSSPVPSEIIARGPRAKRAYLNALKTGKVKVYRARIMLIGQDRAGKTSLKKSFLGLPFDSEEESTDGIEVDPSKFEVNTDLAENWKRTDEKFGVSQFASDLAKKVARDLQEIGGEGDERKNDKENEVEEKGEINLKQAGFDAPERLQGQETNAKPLMEEKPALFKTQVDQGSSGESDVREETNRAVLTDLKIDPSLPPEEFTDHLVQLLKNVNLQSDTTVVEHHCILDLWDFAGQHLYYASYPVFLSTRAVYILVHDLSKKLDDTAQPCCKQGIRKILLSNPNKETNLENLLSWLVSLRTMCSVKPDVNDWKTNVEDLPYCRPPVFIVGTHADKPYQDFKEAESQIQQEISGKDYERHVIRPFFSVDNTQGSSDEGVVSLKKRVIEVLKQEPYMGEEVPIRWFNFERVIKALIAQEVYYLNFEQLQGIIQRVCFIEGEDEAATMLDFYHDLGMIVRHRNTVVIWAQWLIEVFRQLITIRPFYERVPRLSRLWNEMEDTGVLNMELVDHVFSKCYQLKDLIKEDILNMMEQFGLIAKFTASLTDEMYFVPCQLKTPPEFLCEMKLSPSDPCPLYLHFKWGFVPHGLFCQLVSRCTRWYSESGFKETPHFFDGAARFFIGKKSSHQFILLCRKRFIKIILTQPKRSHREVNQASFAETNEVAILVRKFLEETLQTLIRELSWLRNLKCDWCVACPGCLRHEQVCSIHKQKCCTHEDCLCLLKVEGGIPRHCQNRLERPTLPGLEKWFSLEDVSDEGAQISNRSNRKVSFYTPPLSERITDIGLPFLRQIELESKEGTSKPELSVNFRNKTTEKGFVISNNQGEGNCMFFALSEQLGLIKGTEISHGQLRKTVVQYLKENPALPDGTELFNFVNGYSSWDAYLTSMMTDGTWGDHVILHGAANYFKTCIQVVSSHHLDVMICPEFDVTGSKRLVLGHVHELHYVSLIPCKGETVRYQPEVTVTLLENKDLPKMSLPWNDGLLPVDMLLLTVEDCEFLSCLSYLNYSLCKSYCKELGYVYFGEMGEGEIKLRTAVMKCYRGSITAGGSTVSVLSAVRILRPKAVFLVGVCYSLKSCEVKRGDVVISEKLITCVPSSEEFGDKVPLKSLFLRLILNAGDGWEAPLKDPRALEVKIHRGDFLSVPGVIDNNECCETLIKRFPQAVAMELEGQGLHAATHDLDIPWIIIKGISDYKDGGKSGTDCWKKFASLMAASLTVHILSDPMVFRNWPHYTETR